MMDSNEANPPSLPDMKPSRSPTGSSSPSKEEGRRNSSHSPSHHPSSGNRSSNKTTPDSKTTKERLRLAESDESEMMAPPFILTSPGATAQYFSSSKHHQSSGHRNPSKSPKRDSQTPDSNKQSKGNKVELMEADGTRISSPQTPDSNKQSSKGNKVELMEADGTRISSPQTPDSNKQSSKGNKVELMEADGTRISSPQTPDSNKQSSKGNKVELMEADGTRTSSPPLHDHLAIDVPTNTRRLGSNDSTPSAPLRNDSRTFNADPEHNDPPHSQRNANNVNDSQISAELINEEQEQERIMNTLNNFLQEQNTVQVVNVEAEDRLKRQRQRRNFCLYTLLAVAVLGAGVVATEKVTSDKNQAFIFAPTVSPSMSPTMAPTTRESAILQAVVDEFGNLPEDESSPQYRAIHWLIEKDTTIEFPLDSEEAEHAFLERYVAAVFAYTTQYWYWFNNDNWLNPHVHVCEWFGLTCNASGRIGVLDLSVQNLDGPIPR